MTKGDQRQLAPLHDVYPGYEWNGKYAVVLESTWDELDGTTENRWFGMHKKWLLEELNKDQKAHPNRRYFVKFESSRLYCGYFSEKLIDKIRRRPEVLEVAKLGNYASSEN